MKLLAKLSVITLAVALQSCIATKPVEVPELAPLSGPQWSDTNVAAELTDFEQISESSQLNALIAEALANNFDLKAAYERLLAADKLARSAAGPRWPSLDMNLSQREQGAGAVVFGPNVNGSFDLSWEIDVWGRVAAGALQSSAAAVQQQALYHSARYSLAANVANTWFDVIEAKAQLYLAQQRRDNVEKNLVVIRDGFSAGIREALDVYSAKAELASNNAAVQLRTRQLTTLTRQMTLLLGRPVSLDLDIPSQFPTFNAAIPSNLSSELILRRPDIRAAGQALAVQQANLGIAKANRLPRFSLTASYGAIGNNLEQVLNGDITAWTALGGISAPIFRGNQLRAEQQRQYHLLEAEIATYQQTAMQAFIEIEQRLDDEQTLNREVRATAQAVQDSNLADEQALELYISGISNLNTWLQAQRTAFDRQSGLIQLQNQLLKNRVGLYLALGGDFYGVNQP